MRPRVTITGNEKIGELLDVSTAACSVCEGPARVPEDVAAVAQFNDRRIPIVVCLGCCETSTVHDVLALIARVTAEGA